jgi:hypothetical protein
VRIGYSVIEEENWSIETQGVRRNEKEGKRGYKIGE